MSIYFKQIKNRLPNVVLAITLLLFFNSCTSKDDNNDWTKDNLKGEVKSYTEKSYEFINDAKEEYPYRNIQKNYDEKGYMLEENNYKLDGSLDYQFINRYTDDGRLIDKKNIYANGHVSYKWIYEYDETGNVIKHSIFNSNDELTLYRLLVNDENGNRVESKERYVHNPEGVISRKTYEYDEDGNNIQVNIFSPANGELTLYHIFAYDDKGNPIIENIYKANDRLDTEWRYDYVYDDEDNWIKKTEYEVGQPPKTTTTREYVYYD